MIPILYYENLIMPEYARRKQGGNRNPTYAMFLHKPANSNKFSLYWASDKKQIVCKDTLFKENVMWGTKLGIDETAHMLLNVNEMTLYLKNSPAGKFKLVQSRDEPVSRRNAMVHASVPAGRSATSSSLASQSSSMLSRSVTASDVSQDAPPADGASSKKRKTTLTLDALAQNAALVAPMLGVAPADSVRQEERAAQGEGGRRLVSDANSLDASMSMSPSPPTGGSLQTLEAPPSMNAGDASSPHEPTLVMSTSIVGQAPDDEETQAEGAVGRLRTGMHQDAAEPSAQGWHSSSAGVSGQGGRGEETDDERSRAASPVLSGPSVPVEEPAALEAANEEPAALEAADQVDDAPVTGCEKDAVMYVQDTCSQLEQDLQQEAQNAWRTHHISTLNIPIQDTVVTQTNVPDTQGQYKIPKYFDLGVCLDLEPSGDVVYCDPQAGDSKRIIGYLPNHRAARGQVEKVYCAPVSGRWYHESSNRAQGKLSESLQRKILTELALKPLTEIAQRAEQMIIPDLHGQSTMHELTAMRVSKKFAGGPSSTMFSISECGPRNEQLRAQWGIFKSSFKSNEMEKTLLDMLVECGTPPGGIGSTHKAGFEQALRREASRELTEMFDRLLSRFERVDAEYRVNPQAT